jgi:hypothetical protein
MSNRRRGAGEEQDRAGEERRNGEQTRHDGRRDGAAESDEPVNRLT